MLPKYGATQPIYTTSEKIQRLLTRRQIFLCLIVRQARFWLKFATTPHFGTLLQKIINDNVDKNN